MKYDSFRYLYPPRPEYAVPTTELYKYDNGEYYGFPKYNGSACCIFTNGIDLHIYNRHQQLLSKPNKDIEFRKLAKTKNWFVYAGEYLNKGQFGEGGTKEKDKYVIWDLMVWDGEYLIGETLEARLSLLENIYPCSRSMVRKNEIEIYDHLCCTEFKGIYKTPTYLDKFEDLYNDVTKTPLYEGIVLKKRQSKLAFGYQSLNNQDWQIKCRRLTKTTKENAKF